MVCLTGDVHHMRLQNDDQKYLDNTEVETAIEYARIAARAGIKITLFVTGKAVHEEPRKVKRLAEMENVELGGHTYWAFRPKWLYNGLFSRVLGISNGPAFFQNYEIRKTIRIFNRLLGVNIVSWRDHAYRQDKNTYHLLAQNGIRFVSDEVRPDALTPSTKGGLVLVPLNVVPDHDHIYHGDITPETTRNWTLNRDKFPPTLYSVEEWLEIVKRQVKYIVGEGGVATILAHPACMKIADGFKVFEGLCRFLSTCDPVFVKDLVAK